MINDIRKRATELFGAPTLMSMIFAEVDFSKPNDMLEDYTRLLVSEGNRLSPVAKKDYFSAMELTRYLQSLLWIRVSLVNNTLPRDYAVIAKTACIPILWAALIDLVGVATDEDFGITFKPVMTINAEMLMSPSEMVEMSHRIKALERNGFRQTTSGVGRQVEGDLGFMALNHIETEVVSYRRDHPMYAFFSSFFNLQSLETIIGMKSRIAFGSKDQFRLYLHALVSTSS